MASEPVRTQALSAATAHSYAQSWELFTDWCDAADHHPLPADPTTILQFLTDCPAAPATQRRRVIAIDHHHTAAGHPPPGADPRVREAVGRPPVEPAPITQEVRERIEAALRVLPSHGWTPGLFGRRDRCLLTLSQLGRIPHRHLARLTAGDVTLADGIATIATTGRSRTIEPATDPVLCGPCAIARWLDTHQVIVTKIATRAVADHLDAAEPVTTESAHACRTRPPIADERTLASPLLATADQWGSTPFPLSRMSPQAVSRQARDLLDGIITVHRTLLVHPPVHADTSAAVDAQPSAPYTLEQYQAALDRRRHDIASLADVAEDLSAVDRQAAELEARIAALIAMATSS